VRKIGTAAYLRFATVEMSGCPCFFLVPVSSCGSGAYRIPDVYIRGAGSIFDGTIAQKTAFMPQTIDFNGFSLGGNVTIVRPNQLVTNGIQGSYGLHFP
jgi:hypothetical protein